MKINEGQIIQKPKNKILYLIYYILYTTGFMFCSGTILQTFMVSLNINDTTISIYNATTQLSQAIAIIIMVFVADKIRKTIKTFSIVVMSISIISIALIICLFVRSDVTIVKYIIFIASIFIYLMIGVRFSLDYRIIYELFDVDKAGKILGLSIAISGLVSFGFSALYSYSVAMFDYYDVMTVFFIFALISIIISSIICFFFRKNTETQAKTTHGLDFDAFKNKTNLSFIIPSFARGFAIGMLGLITVVGFSKGILSVQTATYISLITQITSFSGNILFSFICKKIKAHITILIFSILLSIVLPLSIVGDDLIPFLIFYAIVNFSLMIVNISVPILAYDIIPYNQIGSFTCIRLMIQMFGSVVASVVYKPLSNLVGFLWLFIITGVVQIICGLTHYLAVKRAKKKQVNT